MQFKIFNRLFSILVVSGAVLTANPLDAAVIYQNTNWSPSGGTGWLSNWTENVETTTEVLFPAGGGPAAGRMLGNSTQRSFWQTGNAENAINAVETFYIRSSIYLDAALDPTHQEYWRRAGGYGLGDHNQGPEVGFSTSQFGGGSGSATEGQWFASNGAGSQTGLISTITGTPFLSKFNTWYTIDMAVVNNSGTFTYDVTVWEHNEDGSIADSASLSNIAVSQNLFNNNGQGTFFYRGTSYGQNGNILYFDELSISTNPFGAPPVPEPSTLLLLGCLTGSLLLRRKRK